MVLSLPAKFMAENHQFREHMDAAWSTQLRICGSTIQLDYES